MDSNPDANKYFNQLKNWKPELNKLRQIILECGLHEDYKWRTPCYTINNKNIVLIANTKEFCSISFLKGELLKDPKNILKKAGPNSRSAKYIAFKTQKEINEKESIIKNYIHEAVVVEKKGLKINFNSSELEYPEELVIKFKENPKFKKAFNRLTKGRQRGYIIHFTGAKQSKTRISRIEKYEERIFNGKGMLDCVCGLSKRMPNCDGSHKP